MFPVSIPSKRLQDVFSVTIFRLPRRFQEVFARRLQDVFKTSWKTINCYAEDVFKTCLEDQQMFAAIQRCFNVDFRLSHVATSYQSKDNVEMTLKCLLGLLINYVMDENLFVNVEYSPISHATSRFSVQKKYHK